MERHIRGAARVGWGVGVVAIKFAALGKKKKRGSAGAGWNKGGGCASACGRAPRLSDGGVCTAERQSERSGVRGNTGN